LKKFITVFLTGFLIISSALISVGAEKNAPLFIFLFIGDGMGVNQYHAAQREGLTESIDSLPVRGEVTTRAFNNVIADSAAAATAIASGVKTRNEMLGLNAKGERVKSITEAAIEKGMSTGIISSMSLNHATPAAFYAHINSRTAYYEIGLQLISSNINYFGGGGLFRHEGREKNRMNLYTLAEQVGYKVFMNGRIPNADELNDYRGRVISVNPVLRSDACMPYVERRPKNGRALADFVKEAIQMLSDNKTGFLIIVEGGNIDYACHDNEFNRMLHEIADFDEAVSEALDFYGTHSENTLIIVTGDHETGGLSFVPKSEGYVKWSSKYHTGASVPIFAIGYESNLFYGVSGIIDNTDIAKILFKMIVGEGILPPVLNK
jgi:alkaline phosphatase